MAAREQHWNDVYKKKGATDVSWYTPNLKTSLSLIRELGLPKTAACIDVGGGASTLVDDLLGEGYTNLTVLDLSAEALATARGRLGTQADAVRWLTADITTVDLGEGTLDLWHDRAVFHFLTDEAARQAYVRTALRALKPGGHIIVATFGPEGPEQCSGLPVVRYDAAHLHGEFGAAFEKLKSVEERHTTPWGSAQEFIYCSCRRMCPR